MSDKSFDDTLLKFALSNGIIDMDDVRKKFEMNEREKYLKRHNSKIWQGKDGKWYTYVPDFEKDRRLIKRSDRKELEDEIIKSYKADENNPTLTELFYEWIDRKVKYQEIQRQTYDRYIRDFKRFYGDTAFSNRRVRNIEEDDLEDFILDTIVEKKLSSKAYSNMRIITRGMLSYAKKRKYTDLSAKVFFTEIEISKKIFKNKKKSDEENVFTQDEIDKLVGYLSQKDTLTNLGVLFAVYTGMRSGEIAALKWEDVHKEFIHVNRRQIVYDAPDGGLVYEIADSTKTDAGTRDVVVVNELKTVIKKLRGINPFTQYVFEKDGAPIIAHSMLTNLYRACDEVGIPRRGMHSLRKTYGTRLINAGVDEAVIINQMGHTNINTTKSYYYYNDKSRGEILNMVEKALSV